MHSDYNCVSMDLFRNLLKQDRQESWSNGIMWAGHFSYCTHLGAHSNVLIRDRVTDCIRSVSVVYTLQYVDDDDDDDNDGMVELVCRGTSTTISSSRSSNRRMLKVRSRTKSSRSIYQHRKDDTIRHIS